MLQFLIQIHGYQFIISEQNILKLVINNDLDTLYPTCSISITDLQGVYTNKLTHIGEYLYIVISPPVSSETDKKEQALALIFLINEHILKKFDYKTIEYTLECSFFTAQNFGAHINYATDRTLPAVSPYKIIFDIMKLANIPMADIKLPNTDFPIHYISDQNHTVKDDIHYCLNMACTDKTPPSYLYYHMIDQEYVFLNNAYIVKNKDYICNTKLALPNINGTDIANSDVNIENPRLYTANTNLLYHQKTGKLKSWTYHHLKRIWEISEILPEQYDNLFNKNIKETKTVKTVYANIPYDDLNIQYSETNFEKDLYFRLHDIETGTNCLEFTVNGNIIRDCGQIINISCHDPNYANQYGGIWVVYSIAHIFENGVYKNVINAFRTFNYQFKDGKKQ